MDLTHFDSTSQGLHASVVANGSTCGDEVFNSIMVHDYCGHPFTAELSRQLARKGWRVMHVFFAQDGGPKGQNTRCEEDPTGLSFHALDIPFQYSKTNFFKRRSGDRAYGRKLQEFLRSKNPDIVLSGNTPTEAQEFIIKYCNTHSKKFIYWCQDFYSLAVRKILKEKLSFLGELVGEYYSFLENRQMQRSSHIIHITEDFLKHTDRWNIPRDKVSIINNWAAINVIPCLDRHTEWSKENKFGRFFRVIYSGTLAMKHNPNRLLDLASAERMRSDVIVVGFGVGADKLSRASQDYSNLTVLPIQPIDVFSQVLASADVLVAVIEDSAGEYSVPSKILSYLCAGRPIVLSAPSSNLAAKIVIEARAGTVVDPHDSKSFVNAVKKYLDCPTASAQAGRNGREYAEMNFDIERITNCFEEVFFSVLLGKGNVPHPNCITSANAR